MSCSPTTPREPQQLIASRSKSLSIHRVPSQVISGGATAKKNTVKHALDLPVRNPQDSGRMMPATSASASRSVIMRGAGRGGSVPAGRRAMTPLQSRKGFAQMTEKELLEELQRSYGAVVVTALISSHAAPVAAVGAAAEKSKLYGERAVGRSEKVLVYQSPPCQQQSQSVPFFYSHHPAHPRRGRRVLAVSSTTTPRGGSAPCCQQRCWPSGHFKPLYSFQESCGGTPRTGRSAVGGAGKGTPRKPRTPRAHICGSTCVSRQITPRTPRTPFTTQQECNATTRGFGEPIQCS